MQTIWKGTVSFGLVSIPVRLYSATEEKNVSFRQVHREDGGRIRYKRVCEVDGQEVSYGDIAKGYELPDGQMVVLEKEDFESLPLISSRAIDVLQFVPAEQIDPLMLAKAYYLSAEGPGAKPYVLLRDALASSGRLAIVKVALRNREQLAALRVRGDVLVLQTMLWPDEVRDASALAPDDVAVRDQEIAMAQSYIETLTADFDPEEFTDEYRQALEELIAAKAEGARPAVPRELPTQDNVLDLMSALRASVEAAKARRGGTPDPSAGAGGGGEESEPEVEEPAAARQAAKGTAAGAGSGAEDPAAKAAGGGRRTAGAKSAATSGAAAKKAAAKTAAGKPAARKTAARTGGTGTAAGKTAPAKAASKTAASKTAASKTAARKSAAPKASAGAAKGNGRTTTAKSASTTKKAAGSARKSA